MYCKMCASPIEQERLEILPNTVFCAPCAQKVQPVAPRRGIMVFSHKTGGELQSMSADYYEKNKRYFVPNGARSVVKNFMRG
jgi:hypothetical protein